MILDGFGVESMIKNLVAEAGYKIVTNEQDVTALLNAAGQYKTRLENTYRKANGKDIRWQSKTSAFILDHIYKADLLVDVSGSKYAIQLTTNPYAVDEKLEVIEGRLKNGLYKTAGIDAIAVVLVEPGERESILKWTDQERDSVKEQIYDLIDCLIDAGEIGQVGEFTIKLP